MIDASAVQMVLAVLTGWLDRQERQAVAYLMEENRVLRQRLGQRRLQFTDVERRDDWFVDLSWDGGSCVRSPPS